MAAGATHRIHVFEALKTLQKWEKVQLKIEKELRKKKKLEAGTETDKGDESRGNVDRRRAEHESGVAPKDAVIHVRKNTRKQVQPPPLLYPIT